MFNLQDNTNILSRISWVFLRSKSSFNELRQSADLALLLLKEYSGDDCGLSFTGKVTFFLAKITTKTPLVRFKAEEVLELLKKFELF